MIRSQSMDDQLFADLLTLLRPLANVAQAPVYHPEGDVLYHSLQVFTLACRATDDPVLWAAALFHDVGKGHAPESHAVVGAQLLGDLAQAPVCWLIEHHQLLLVAPRDCRRRFAAHPRLPDLRRLRTWDLAGRSPHAWVPDVELALGELLSPGVAEHWLAADAVGKDALAS